MEGKLRVCRVTLGQRSCHPRQGSSGWCLAEREEGNPLYRSRDSQTKWNRSKVNHVLIIDTRQSYRPLASGHVLRYLPPSQFPTAFHLLHLRALKSRMTFHQTSPPSSILDALDDDTTTLCVGNPYQTPKILGFHSPKYQQDFTIFSNNFIVEIPLVLILRALHSPMSLVLLSPIWTNFLSCLFNPITRLLALPHHHQNLGCAITNLPST